MKKLFAFLIVFTTLYGCKDDGNGVPIKEKFPQAVDELLVACPDLKKMDENTDKLSDLLYAVNDNYKTYYECKSKVDSWREWYKFQKENYDVVKKAK